MQLRPRLIEVHRVFDGLRSEVVDLLEPEPEPLLICDRSLAARACRFTTILGWFFPLPHFWRSFGFGIAMPAIGSLEPQDAAAEIVRHLGGPEDRAAWNEWFGLNCARFSEALSAVSLARREQMFAGMDAEFGKAVYDLRAPFAECRDTLDAIAAVAHDPLADGEENEGFAEARVWFDESPPFAQGAAARAVLGRVLLGQAHWRLEAMGAEKLSRLRPKFEEVFADRVRFTGERRDNFLAHLKSKEPKYDRALVPPRLLENPSKVVLTSNRVPAGSAAGSKEEIISEFTAEYDRAWLDESIPALDGKTPREAARDPALRPRLIRLLKERVHGTDERNLETGGTADANWLLEELGAREIVFDPPPLRALTGRKPGNAFESEDEDDFDDADDLEPWPPLPPEPFTMAEAVERLLIGLRDFDSLTDAIEAMEEAGGFLIEDVRDVVGTLLTAEEHDFLEGYLVQVWFAFVPPGCFGPDMEPREIHEALGRQLSALEAAAGAGREASGRFLLEQGPQPQLVQALAGQLFEHRKEYTGSHKLQNDTAPLMLAILKTVIELLDSKCRADDP